MDLRKQHENKLKYQIKHAKYNNNRDYELVERMKGNSQTGDMYYINQVAKAKNNIQERLAKIEEYEEDILKLNSGKLDSMLMAEKDASTKEYKDKQEASKRKKIHEAGLKKKEHDEFQHHMDTDRKSFRNDKYYMKNMDREYKYFLRICDSVPSYMMKNLKEMPSNKGYIWRKLYIYGELPAEKGQPRVMFERVNRDIMYIHERNGNVYTKYEKRGKERKRVVENYTVKSKHSYGVSLMDLVNK
jgi:hypothetical protein